MGKDQHGSGASGITSALGIAAISALAGFAAVYVTLGRPDNAAVTTRSSAATPAVSATPAKLNTGHMTAFVYKPSPEALAELPFQDGDGKPLKLADWKGKAVLLNLWATWCGPCRKEMPALDKLQKDLGSDKFEVVALSVDRNGTEVAKKFLAEIKVEALRFYIDPTSRATSTLKAVGMPTTILIGADGLEIGRLVGPAEWDSDDAKKLIKSVLK